MTKAVYERKHLVGVLFTVSKGSSLIIMAWSVAAGRHGTGAAAKS